MQENASRRSTPKGANPANRAAAADPHLSAGTQLHRARARALHPHIDFFVASGPDNVERLERALHSVFDDDSIDEIDSGDLAGACPVIQYGPPHGDFTIDFVARLGDAFTYDDVRVRVATPRMLYEMKRDTVRPQDRIDAERLRQRFGLEAER